MNNLRSFLSFSIREWIAVNFEFCHTKTISATSDSVSKLKTFAPYCKCNEIVLKLMFRIFKVVKKTEKKVCIVWYHKHKLPQTPYVILLHSSEIWVPWELTQLHRYMATILLGWQKLVLRVICGNYYTSCTQN